MLVIDPEICIDCGVCEPECPADAIIADTAEGAEKWVEINTKYAKLWPVITDAKEPLIDADEFDGTPNKYETIFSPEPALG
jgi:ferredoxin